LNISEICQLLDKCREVGVSHIEIEEIKADFANDRVNFSDIASPILDMAGAGTIQGSLKMDTEDYLRAAQISDPIRHKSEQLQSLLKLDDKDLVDQLFPDHTDSESA
jgi:hypothetical protein